MREVLSQGNGNRAMVLEQLQSEIDLVNLSTAMRLARRPDLAQAVQWRHRTTDVRPLLLEPGGYLGTRRLAELVTAAGGLEGLVRGLSDTHYGRALTAGCSAIRLVRAASPCWNASWNAGRLSARQQCSAATR
jgi:vacuolar-type H+-ATPase subunit C/Vma6